MTKLNDTQLILLSTAAQRDGGSIYPTPDTLAADRVAKALAGLVKRGLAEERETSDPANVHRSDGDLRFGVFITDAGSKAIGVDSGVCDDGASAGEVAASDPPKPERVTKSAAVLELLARDDGATLAELIAATGWLPHTTRAALTGLRKKGHAIERSKRADQTCYRIRAAA